jgi:hypothetical protein
MYSEEDLEKVAFDPATLAMMGLLGGGNRGMGFSPMPALGAVGLATPLKGFSDTLGYRINRRLNDGMQGLAARVKADEVAAAKVVGKLTDFATDMLLGKVKDLKKGFGKAMDAPKRNSILRNLVADDEMIRAADPEDVSSLYQTMVRFAPTLSKDSNAVRSFLRTGVSFPEGGVDANTIGMLAKAELLAKGGPKHGGGSL